MQNNDIFFLKTPLTAMQKPCYSILTDAKTTQRTKGGEHHAPVSSRLYRRWYSDRRAQEGMINEKGRVSMFAVALVAIPMATRVGIALFSAGALLAVEVAVRYEKGDIPSSSQQKV